MIIETVVAGLQTRYGRARRFGASRRFSFGPALACSLNYSKTLSGHRFFFGLARDVLDPEYLFPSTIFGDFVALVCGSADTVLFLPRSLVLDAMNGVSSRRLDIFDEDGIFILQTTKHPKLDVSEFVNAFPKAKSPEIAEETVEPELRDRSHVRIQWALIQLGRAEGCSVWVPTADRNLAYRNERFDLATLERLPAFGFEENTRRIVQNIDVLWLTKNVIRKAFEIESTTMIYSGLLRLNDLVLAQPNNQIDLYIVAGASRRPRVQSQLIRPSFHSLLDKCEYVPFEFIDEQLARLESIPLKSGARVTGLIHGERFSLPEHYVYPGLV